MLLTCAQRSHETYRKQWSLDDFTELLYLLLATSYLGVSHVWLLLYLHHRD